MKRGLFYLLLICCAGVLVSGCHPNQDTRKDHLAQINKISLSAQAIGRNNHVDGLFHFNREFNKIEYPSLRDQCEKYKFYILYHQFDSKTIKISYQYTDSLLDILRPFSGELKFRFDLAHAHLLRGDILLKKGYYRKAYRAYFKGKSFIGINDVSIKDSVFYANFYQRLGDVYFEKEMFKESASWQKKGLSYFTKLNGHIDRHTRIIGTLNNIALAYTKAKMNDSAVLYYRKGLAYLDAHAASIGKQDVVEFKGMISGNLGEVYADIGEFDLAEKMFKIDIIANRYNYSLNEGGVITSIKLANIYFKQNRLKEFRTVFKNIRKLEHKLTGNVAILQFRLLEARYYESLKLYSRAIQEYKVYLAKYAEFMVTKKALLDSDMLKDFEIYEKNAENERLDEVNRFQSFVLILILLFLLLLLMMIYVLVHYYKRERQSNKILALFNSKMELTVNELNKSNKNNYDLIRMVAHDLKNPIHAIGGITKIMNDMPSRNDEDHKLLDLIRRTSENLEELILNVLSTNNSNTHNVSERINFLELVEQSCDLLQFNASEKSQKIELLSNGIFVDIDPEKIWRVINNLLINAIKFSPDHSIISISWEHEGEYLVVSISDQGSGIPFDLQKVIFEFDTEAARSGTAGEKSFGMGLAISRQIVEEQGGTLWLDKSNSQGSVFKFSLFIKTES